MAFCTIWSTHFLRVYCIRIHDDKAQTTFKSLLASCRIHLEVNPDAG